MQRVSLPRRSIRSRAILIGFVFTSLLCAVTPYNNYYLQNSRIAGNHLPVGSVFVLLFLVFANIPLRWLSVRLVLRPAELMVVWVMLLATVGIPSMGFLQFMLPTLVAPYYFATPANEWAETLHPHIPDWLAVRNLGAVRDFYEGLGASGMVPWNSWVKPLAVWTGFLLVFYFTMYCLSTILRRQWTERERFAFPLIQVPLELVRAPDKGNTFNTFFTNRLLWVGVLIPAIFHFINGLHANFPRVPEIPSVFNVYRAFQDKPWYTLGWWPAFRVVLYFSVIGIATLLTLEVSFSLWFFFLFFKFQYIVMNALGWSIGPWVSCSRQVMGGYLVFVPTILWMARGHLREVVQRAIDRPTSVEDTLEPLSYRVAFFGLVGGLLGMVLLCGIAGMALWVAVILVAVIFITSIVLSWMVVNGGLLLVQAPFFPSEYITVIAGSSVIPTRSLVLLSYQRGFLRDWGEFMMPNFLHTYRASEEVQLNPRQLTPLLFVAILVAIAVSTYFSLDLIYTKGASYLQRWVYVNAPRGYFAHISQLIQYPSQTQWNEVYSLLGGAAFALFLLWMRTHFVWWSLHPIGYLLGATYPPFHLWSSIAIGWLMKYTILKFGGVVAYQRFRPFCLGLILGEYLMVGFWMVVGWFTGVGYFALPS